MDSEQRVREPEIREPGVTTTALVPARTPRGGRVAQWLRRVTGLVTPRVPELPPGLSRRIDDLERELAAHAEQTAKRLVESEGRVLHLLEQRFESLAKDLAATLRRSVESEVAAETGSLRRWLVATLLLALLGGGAAALALVLLLSGRAG